MIKLKKPNAPIIANLAMDFAAIHSAELWPHLNQGTLRGPGCTHPSTPPPPG